MRFKEIKEVDFKSEITVSSFWGKTTYVLTYGDWLKKSNMTLVSSHVSCQLNAWHSAYGT